MLRHIGQRGDDLVVFVHRLQHWHELVVNERIRRPALAQVRRLDRLGVVDRGRAKRSVRLHDRRRRALHQELREVGIDPRGERIDAGQAQRVGRRLVVCRGDEHTIQMNSRRLLHQRPDLVLVDVEQALLIDDLNGDRVRAVGNDEARAPTGSATRVKKRGESLPPPSRLPSQRPLSLQSRYGSPGSKWPECWRS